MQEFEIKNAMVDAIMGQKEYYGWTQTDLAEKLGTHQSRISLIANRRLDDMRIDALVSYCARLGLTVTLEVV